MIGRYVALVWADYRRRNSANTVGGDSVKRYCRHLYLDLEFDKKNGGSGSPKQLVHHSNLMIPYSKFAKKQKSLMHHIKKNFSYRAVKSCVHF